MPVQVVRQGDLLPASRRQKEIFLPRKQLREVRAAIEVAPLKRLWDKFLDDISARLNTRAPEIPKGEAVSTDGVNAYYSAFRIVLADVLNSSFAHAITGEDKFSGLARTRIREVLSWHTWVHPAHHPKTIDLVTSSIARTLAVASHWLGPAMPTLEREEISRALDERLFEQYITGMLDERGWWARDCATNWCAVVNGGIGCSMLYFIDDNALLADMVNEILKRLSIYVKGFAPDGGWIEGVSYWSSGITWYLYFADALEKATRGRVNPTALPQMKKAGAFPLHAFMPPDRMVNFCDSFSPLHIGLSLPLLKLAHEFNKPPLRWLASRVVKLAPKATDPYLFMWYTLDGGEEPPAKEPTGRVFKEIQWAMIRNRGLA